MITLFNLIFLAEYFYLERLRKKFKWRIAVGGIRGKSSVTRLIAGAMREAGIRVMARTTGSRPVVIFPNGREEEINRSGLPSILEGKKFLNLARREKAEAIVVELMAIQPECLVAEVKKIFKPHFLLLTNFRPDHIEELGRSREEVARNLLQSVEKGSAVFLLEEEIDPEIRRFLERKKTNLISVSKRGNFGSSKKLISQDLIKLEPKDLRANYGDDFTDNIRLALAVTRYLGLNDELALSGMKKAKPDFGSLKIWQMALPGKPPGYTISAFAANEPLSSFLVLKRIKELIPWEGKKIYGLLLFRRDRGDRTKQWLEAIREGFFKDFDGLFLYDCPSLPLISFQRKIKKDKMKFENSGNLDLHLPNLSKKDFRSQNRDWPAKEKKGAEKEKKEISRSKGISWGDLSFCPEIKRLKAEEVMNLVGHLSRELSQPWIVIGLGNIVGLGSQLVDLWGKIGRRIYG